MAEATEALPREVCRKTLAHQSAAFNVAVRRLCRESYLALRLDKIAGPPKAIAGTCHFCGGAL